jgi:dTDP-glucose 4,6-dehydratase
MHGASQRSAIMGAPMDTMIVTGGAGFIGCNFVRHALAETGDRVVVADKLTYAGNLESLRDVRSHPRFAFVQADIADRDAVRQIFREHRPDALVNFAAETHVDRSIDDPAAFVRTNVAGTFELLEAARRHLAERGEEAREGFRFLHVSTDEVYGTLGETGAFREDTAYAPNSPYAASKAGADHLVRAYHETYGLPTLLTNCSNNYGPYQFPEKLIPLMILNAAEGRSLPIYGDGGNVRDWLYVDDHCRGIRLVLEKARPGGKYNLGGGNERTNLQVVDRLCEVMEKVRPAAGNEALQAKGLTSYTALKTFVKDRPGHDRRYAIDASHVRAELGWRPDHAFEAGLERTVRWYLENPSWCEAVQSGKYGRERLGKGALSAAAADPKP